MNTHRRLKILLKALKIAVGGGLAIMCAELLGLSYATSAGIVTLLTVQDTKRGTIQLTADRLLSFLLSVLLIFVCFHFQFVGWINYILYILLMVTFCCFLNWQNTISVNAVMGTHYLMTPDYSIDFAMNELALIVIGTGFALAMNWRMPNYRNAIREDMYRVEEEMKRVLLEMASYLDGKLKREHVWSDLDGLEELIHEGSAKAQEQLHNTGSPEDAYCADYMEMRLQQCSMLQTMRGSIRKVKKVPVQADYIRRYLCFLAEYMHERDIPGEEMWKLQDILDQMTMEALPRSREEFESRALLFHVLMDLEEFLKVKQHFLETHARSMESL